jgi:hypothetical protein
MSPENLSWKTDPKEAVVQLGGRHRDAPLDVVGGDDLGTICHVPGLLAELLEEVRIPLSSSLRRARERPPPT